MSKTFLALSGFMIALILVHLFMGGPEYADAFQQTLPDDHLRSMAMVLWHAVTVILIIQTFAYIRLAVSPNLDLTHFISAMQVGWAVLFVVVGWLWLGTLWTMPQWVAFLLTAVIAEIGIRYHPKRLRVVPAQ